MRGGRSGLVIGDVLTNSVRGVCRHPVRALLILGVVPAVWAQPGIQLRGELGVYGAGIGMVLAFVVAKAAWQSLLTGGLTCAAIDLASGGKPTVATLLQGVRVAPGVFVAILALEIPSHFLGVPDPSLAEMAGMVVLLPMMVVLGIRGIVWVQFIVDRGEPIVRAFRSSWTATRGASLQIALLLLLLMVPLGMVGFLALELPAIRHALSAVSSLVLEVVVASVYLSFTNGSESRIPIAPIPSDGAKLEHDHDAPSRGTGWSRDAKP